MTEIDRIVKTDEAWRKELSPEAYDVLRKQGTERAFSGRYDQHFTPGRYRCAGCGNELFGSDAKFDAGCGWPSFSEPADQSRVALERDTRHGMERIEVKCSRCGGHLGHVFDDGPRPTGQRFCINSVALKFNPEKK